MAKLTDLIDIPKGINKGMTPAGNRAMLSVLGNPRSSYGRDCKPITNAKLKARIITASAGPMRVTGLDCAVHALQKAMEAIKIAHPDVYAVLGSAGMLCCRRVRGSKSAISNHSWGTAIDLTVSGKLVPMGKPKCQRGLALIAPILNNYGFFWGAGFHRPDSMHFEASKEVVIQWARNVPTSVLPVVDVLSMGDRGKEVAALQKALNKAGEKLKVDGDFGPATRAAVIAYQAAHGVRPDGLAGMATLAHLDLLT